MIIDRSDEHENAYDSIRVNDDGNSNEIDSSQAQDQKLFDPTISTDDEMTISFAEPK
jgi:hypothetical protein